eukprot:TRINITY_DN13833_c0_g1_i1.p1 TRINITY_DN13833_c0_g1~~TRINITY_DN13833_c0_g1_i1.p1  ORF type:complete len:393 (+),score=84.16 TRINITY_DN13833_c0_g1_i1:73-1179(+)
MSYLSPPRPPTNAPTPPVARDALARQQSPQRAPEPPNLPGLNSPIFNGPAKQPYNRQQVSRPLAPQPQRLDDAEEVPRPPLGSRVVLRNMKARGHLEGRTAEVVLHDPDRPGGVRVNAGEPGGPTEEVDVGLANYRRAGSVQRPPVGDAVRAQGLRRHRQLNGQVGVVCRHDPAREDGVRVEFAGFGEVMMRVANLEHPVRFGSPARGVPSVCSVDAGSPGRMRLPPTGTSVTAHGLRSRPDLNGARGTVLEQRPGVVPEEDRVVVEFEGQQGALVDICVAALSWAEGPAADSRSGSGRRQQRGSGGEAWASRLAPPPSLQGAGSPGTASQRGAAAEGPPPRFRYDEDLQFNNYADDRRPPVPAPPLS